MTRPLVLLILLIAAACTGPAAAAPTPEPTTPGCPLGRPQSEIDIQGRLPLEPRDQAIRCVYLAESGSRVYLLVDGRHLSVYQREGGIPTKPGAKVPDEAGTRTIDSRTWEWARYEGTIVLRTTTPDSIYVEFAMNSVGNSNSVVDELARIAGTLRRT